VHDLSSVPSRHCKALDGRHNIRVRNWVQLVAEAMGIEASDAYVGWRNGGAPDIAAIECAEPSHYQTLIEPELRKEPPLPGVGMPGPHAFAGPHRSSGDINASIVSRPRVR
jgi:hypothetical protein